MHCGQHVTDKPTSESYPPNNVTMIYVRKSALILPYTSGVMIYIRTYVRICTCNEKIIL